ncbi:MAG: ABC transporter ATP-binding protein [Acidimicrobiia bacterium]|nr:ABC transporter ATP-binding protein [Acidimicrobiia bacterium]
MSDTPAILVENLSKQYRLYHERNQSLKATILRGRRARYDEFWALKDVSFEVPQGATFALIGENGSGKSTLLKCLARILAVDGGSLTTHGKISALLELGAGFHQELSGRENVYLNGSILGLSRKQISQRFDEIVDFAGLEKFIDTPVKNYSSGMYVRLGFSVAINVEPDILLVDEVLAVGDAEFQLKCMEKVDQMRGQGRTIVIVTHALGSVRNLCDTALLLEHGEMKRVGPAAEVIEEYMADVFTDRVPDGEHGQRWGSGEAEIEDIEILDAAGQRAKRIRTGDAITFRIRYKANERITQPVFGLAIHRLDGTEITGPNTREADLLPDAIDGPGCVDLRVDRLLLVPGTYDLSGSVANRSLSHAYDMRHRSFRFDVEQGDPLAEFGIVSLGGTWGGSIFQR